MSIDPELLPLLGDDFKVDAPTTKASGNIDPELTDVFSKVPFLESAYVEFDTSMGDEDSIESMLGMDPKKLAEVAKTLTPAPAKAPEKKKVAKHSGFGKCDICKEAPTAYIKWDNTSGQRK